MQKTGKLINILLSNKKNFHFEKNIEQTVCFNMDHQLSDRKKITELQNDVLNYNPSNPIRKGL